MTNADASGNRLDVRDLRKRMGWTQRQFAERLHVTPLTVLRWETGQSTPRPLALAKLRELEREFAADQPANHDPVPQRTPNRPQSP